MPFEERLQPGPALGERLRSEIVVAFAQQIERDERRGLLVGPEDRLRRSIAGNGHMDAILQPLEARRMAFGVQRDDLAVENHRTFEGTAPFPERLDELGKLRGLLVAQPRPESDRRLRRFGGG